MSEMVQRAIGFAGCAALAIVFGWLFFVAVDMLIYRHKVRRREKICKQCGPCVHLHFSRHDGYACDPHFYGNCTPKTQECYYPSDY